MCSNAISVLINISLFVKHGMQKGREWRNMYYLLYTLECVILFVLWAKALHTK